MAHLLRMPEVAAGSDHAVLQEWSVAENEAFSAADPLATIETDKAVVEVEAEAAGVLLRTLAAAGASVPVGDPIALVGEPGEDVPDIDALLDRLDDGRRQATAVQPEAEPDEGAEAAVRAQGGSSSPAPISAGDRGRLFISPLARRLAQEAGLDPSGISGTGPRGRIRKRDVEAALAAVAIGANGASEPAGAGARPDLPGRAATSARYSEVPHTRLRRAVASRLTESKQTVPHFYVRGTADVGALVRLREELNDGAPVKVSVNDLLVKAIAVAHRRHPDMNAVWTDDAVRTYESVDVAVAVASERGLVTPVLRRVDSMSVTAVARTVRDLVGRANAGRLRQDELEGGTISLSNLGMFGVEEFSAIINPPHAAILSVGAIREEPVVRDGELAVARVLHLVLSVDHRPVDGAVAAGWMRTFLSILERPVQILA
jgi:pyruvate dehydrogenase E2 component (dihydrolipoamide acetyltransferase)